MSNSKPETREPALHRLVQKINPSPRPTYGPNRINKTQQPQPPLLSRIISKHFPVPARTDVPWYSASIGSKLDRTSGFFARATGAEGEKLEELLHSVRDRAWAVDAYPCFGRWLFVLPGISGLPWYQDAVAKRAKDGATVLDLGCGLGQEIRRVAALDGVNSSQLYAVDVSRDLWMLGSELFDNAAPSAAPLQFIQADARTHRYTESLRENSEELFALSGKVDVVLMGLFLDLFHYPDQVEVGKTIVGLSRVGTQVIGYSRGTAKGYAVEEEVRGTGTRSMIHDDASLAMLWFDIGQLTRTKWKTEARLVDVPEMGWEEDDVSWMGGPPVMGICYIITREER